jgi:hypothetical protein
MSTAQIQGLESSCRDVPDDLFFEGHEREKLPGLHVNKDLMLHLQTSDSPVLSGICRVPLDRTKMKTGHCTCFLCKHVSLWQGNT